MQMLEVSEKLKERTISASRPLVRIVGIDPGISGAVALNDGVTQKIEDIPVIQLGKAKIVNAAALHDILLDMEPDIVVIEKVAAMPQNSSRSSFNFGYTAGVCYGVSACIGAKIEFVTPAMWKKHFGLIGKPKDAGRSKAILSFPNARQLLKRKKDQDRAEALLMTQWCHDKMLH